MFCMQCGAQLPDGSQFCAKCGARLGGGAPAPAPAQAAPQQASFETQEMKCKSCGAPLQPTAGMSIVNCEYCGNAVTLSGAGWKQVMKQLMVINKLSYDQALAVGKSWLDEGIFRRNVGVRSEVVQTYMKYVPYWVVPTAVDTKYSGTRGTGMGAVKAGAGKGAGGFLKGLAVAGLERSMSGGKQHNVNDRKQKSFNVPVVAVRGLALFELEDYEFKPESKAIFDKNKLDRGVEIMGGDVTEQEALDTAKAFASKKTEQEVRGTMDYVASLQTDCVTHEGELLYVPVWFFEYKFKEKNYFALVDGSAGKVMKGQRPAIALR